ncbi:MAG: (d)CMP kinase [Gammaproteobacteria bacterium]|nr:(d)CMP kinase [Gammaproteobacteria bacterium]
MNPSAESRPTAAKAPVICIDGPAGAGKGVVAGDLAGRLGWRHLDSGALYRTVALALLRGGLMDADESRIEAYLRECRFEFNAAVGGEGNRVLLNGADLSAEIRAENVGVAASRIASLSVVRRFLLARQRRFRRMPGLVAEGRDMASVVFPDAPLRIYLHASLEKRAERRHKQLKQKGINASMGDLIRDLAERDRRDRDRPLAPLKRARQAEVLDTTALTVLETRDAAWRLVTAVWPGMAAG